MASDSRTLRKSQFTQDLRSPTAGAIRDRWELNRTVEHGKLVKRQKPTVPLSKPEVSASSAMPSIQTSSPSTPESFQEEIEGCACFGFRVKSTQVFPFI